MPIKLRIEGMTCDHCAQSVQAALEALPGVEARVSFAESKAIISAGEHPAATLIGTVAERGFRATVLEGGRGEGLAPEGGDLQVAILGSGSAAFAAAIRLAEGGARVTMVERGTLGGTCVNVGCVPSKILLRAAHVAHLQAEHPFVGIPHRGPIVDRAAMVAQQQGRVDELRQAKYADILTAHPGVRLLHGTAWFADARTVHVDLADGGEEILRPDRVLIATGSSPWIPPIEGLASTPFWTSTEALVAEAVPEHLIVIGGGLVAVELGQAFRRLGARVTILARSRLLSSEEPALGEGLAEVFRGEGIDVRLHTVPSSVRYERDQFVVETSGGFVGGDRLLVAAGRRANTEGLGLERAGVLLDSCGAVAVDERFRTSVPHVYAAGDCTSLPELVYVAAATGSRAAENMRGGNASLDLSTMPAVVFTEPQVAWVGLTEAGARQRGLAVESRTLPLGQVPRALANFDTRGFVKMVAEAGTGKLLGVQLLAESAGEVIQTAALAMRAGMSVQELGAQLFPYLTMAEGLKLAAQTFSRDVRQLSCCAA